MGKILSITPEYDNKYPGLVSLIIEVDIDVTDKKCYNLDRLEIDGDQHR